MNLSKRETVIACGIVRRIGDLNPKPRLYELSNVLVNNKFTFRYLDGDQVKVEIFGLHEIEPVLDKSKIEMYIAQKEKRFESTAKLLRQFFN